ncbi:MAG: 1-deoxy-D-xylulose-5-phosphate reductoisomerase [Candidatus Aminicenantes bacterium]|nr:1-deoxy-D-xylulose-5-phosphate reductoisomerase [Candidatus Aminicenantes bacterium]
MNRNIALLGSTGSIGKNTLEVIKNNRDKLKIVSLACGNNLNLIRSQIREFTPEVVSISSKIDCDELRSDFPQIKIYSGEEGIMEVAMANGVDTLVTATSGTHSIHATLESIKKGKRICLANKETLVTAGELVNQYLDRSDSELIPIDSEQSAIFQCLCENDRKFLNKVILTASGGPFFKLNKDEFVKIGIDDALNHPVWSMGKKITIDSSTMMNKALEIIEAFYLFNLDIDQIDLLIHPQSIIHSMVEFTDNSIIAQMGIPDMKIPIQYSLSYPERFSSSSEKLDLAKTGSLEFYNPDPEKFPSIRMAYEVIEDKKNSGLIFNASNEVAVESFLNGEISFPGIYYVVENMLDKCKKYPVNSSDDISPMIEEVEKLTSEFIKENISKME